MSLESLRYGPWAPKGVVAVLDTNVLIRAWLGGKRSRTPAQSVVLLAGVAYNGFTSPAILEELEEVLTRPRFGATQDAVRLWLDEFVRVSRQVFPESIPAADARVVHGDVDDLPILGTAYAVDAAATEYAEVLAAAQGQRYLVSQNTRHFTPGWNVFGWNFLEVETFQRLLLARGAAAAPEEDG